MDRLINQIGTLRSAWLKKPHTCATDDSCFPCAAYELNDILAGLGEPGPAVDDER